MQFEELSLLKFPFLVFIKKIFRKYKDRAEHDQKLLNIMFHFNPDMLHQLACSWNFKNNFCMDDGNICKSAEENGAGAVHGITSAFFGDVNPTFRSLYEGTFLNYHAVGIYVSRPFTFEIDFVRYPIPGSAA